MLTILFFLRHVRWSLNRAIRIIWAKIRIKVSIYRTQGFKFEYPVGMFKKVKHEGVQDVDSKYPLRVSLVA